MLLEKRITLPVFCFEKFDKICHSKQHAMVGQRELAMARLSKKKLPVMVKYSNGLYELDT